MCIWNSYAFVCLAVSVACDAIDHCPLDGTDSVSGDDNSAGSPIDSAIDQSACHETTSGNWMASDYYVIANGLSSAVSYSAVGSI